MERCTNHHAQKITFEDVLKHDSYLRSILRRFARDKHEENDMMQEGYIKVLGALDSFRGECSLRTWLHVIFKNAAIAYLQSNRAPTVSLNVVDDDGEFDECEAWLASDSQRPDLLMEAQQRIEGIAAAFSSLPLALRLVVELRYHHGMQYEQIADTLKIPIGTVRSRLFRANKELGLSDPP